jgi:hypothetical protein
MENQITIALSGGMEETIIMLIVGQPILHRYHDRSVIDALSTMIVKTTYLKRTHSRSDLHNL